MFPMTIAGGSISFSSSQEDWDSGVNSPICICSGSFKVGTPMSFWEPAIIIDSHMTAGCFPTLGGMTLPIGGNTGGTNNHLTGKGAQAFRHSTYYVSPLMYLLSAILDDSCSDRSAFNVGWTTELDPSWNDDELASIKMPIAYAFGSMPGVLAAGVDSIAANIGFPISEIFWHAGSWGPIYPLTGNGEYSTDDQFGRLITTKMLATAHDMGELWNLFANGSGRSYGADAMCSQLPSSWPTQLIMNKRQYKVSRLYPIPQTSKIDGLCCSPIGRSTVPVETMTQGPTTKFKDFGYIVFRKRDCCAGVIK
jgi:conjugal transfer pilus assembly protein TraU